MMFALIVFVIPGLTRDPWIADQVRDDKRSV